MNAFRPKSDKFALLFIALLGASSAAQAHDPGATALEETNASSSTTPKPLAVNGQTALDSAKLVWCPTTTCRIEIDQNVVIAQGSGSTALGICSRIDGVAITPCVDLGFIPHYRQSKNFVQYSTISYGHHKVQTYVYSNMGGTVAAWGVNYRVYK